MKVNVTEGQLRNMIAESIKRYLNEIDWKTYDSAMRKAAERGEWHRAGKFGDASKSAFNRDFGSNDSPYDYNYQRQNVPYRTGIIGYKDNGEPIYDDNTTQSNKGFYDDDVIAYSDSYDPDCLEKIRMGFQGFRHRRTPDGKFHTTMKDIDKYTDNDDFNQKDNDYDYWYQQSGDESTRADAMQKARKGAKETRHYLNGEYTYDNQKGWHLKDKKDNK